MMRRCLVVLAICGLVAAACGPSDRGADEHPFNIVFIMADDLSADAFDRGFNRSLEHRSALEDDLIAEGALLPNFFLPTPLCCPSRASFLTGQYPHNHRVHVNNGQGAEDNNGGILRFWLDQRDATSLGVWMQAAGYQTAFVGKYLNGYPNLQTLDEKGVTEQYVPLGWNEWHATFVNDRAARGGVDFGYYHFRTNDNGVVTEHGPEGAYLTDWERDRALDFLDTADVSGEPFLLYLSAAAPHGPLEPRSDHIGLHASASIEQPSSPSCNEQDLSDKPSWIRDEPELRSFPGGCIAAGGRILDLTLALDDLVAAVVGKLAELDLLDTTYVFFVSDNGILTGQHRIAGKSAPYEESVRVPMVVRGPGIQPGTELDHLVINADIAPTFLDIAGGTANAEAPPIDGESLRGVLTGVIDTEGWRSAVLLELLQPITNPNQPHVVPGYRAVRTARYVLIEYETGDVELYDLEADPYQLESIHADAPAGLITELAGTLDRLADCAGAACAEAARP